MRLFLMICTMLAVSSVARAEPIPGPCRVERQVGALSACLEMALAQRVVKMSQQINDMLAQLQAATSGELRALQLQYDDAQDIWLERLAERCEVLSKADPVAFQRCRLSALAGREKRLALSLQRASDDFGAPLAYTFPTPDSVEIHIPLPIPLPYPGAAEIPLILPLSPD